ncbi:importin subunit alpha-1b [Trichonephila clavata]|uniref:Importin subunit alpha-1b n=1 Tax=Trichonephila clavata TaxID=2740835 RepID=A0A8X6GDT7_TRICU|nr:importin subunit alpha-1b [Trichonephila clavata]
MQEVAIDDPIQRLRAENREELNAFRKKDRESLFKQRRLKLFEVEALAGNISTEQFKELVLQLKQKKSSIEVLKGVKNNCCTPVQTETFFKIDGAFNALIRILIGNDAAMQLEAAACLTNLACGSHKAAKRIIKGAGPYLISFIGSGSHYLQGQSAWAAGNLANDCSECFSLLKVQGLIPALFSAVKSSSMEVIKSTVYALQACTAYGDPDLRSFIEPENFKDLLNLLKEKNIDKHTLSSTAFTLSNIYYLRVSQNCGISNTEAEIILNCLRDSISNYGIEISIALPLTRCLGFMSVEDKVCHFLSENVNFHFVVLQVFNCEGYYLKVELLWVLANIAACGKMNVIVNSEAILKIINFSANHLDGSCMQVLYHLCTLAMKCERIRELLREHDINLQIQSLQHCGENILEQAAETFLRVINN